jgi:hypothetical protein
MRGYLMSLLNKNIIAHLTEVSKEATMEGLLKEHAMIEEFVMSHMKQDPLYIQHGILDMETVRRLLFGKKLAEKLESLTSTKPREKE